MDAVNDPNIEQITWVKSSQVGASEVMLNVLGYHIEHDPCPILLLMPSEKAAIKFSKKRIAPMIQDTPAIRDKVSKAGSKKNGNTLLEKDFAGGSLVMVGANAPAGLASDPIRIVLADEVDRYTDSAGKEGDPLSLAHKRTNNFWNRLKVNVSTPTVKGESRIDDLYEDSDQRKFMVPCPHCEERQELVWENVQWDKDQKKGHLHETAHYVCVHCGSLIHESDKYWMLLNGEWTAHEPGGNHAGFHISEIYSPWKTWADMAKEYLHVCKDKEKLKVWWNTSLGLSFDEIGEELDSDPLYARREYFPADCPKGVLLVVAAVDVQDDRVEVTVDGYCKKRKNETPENWTIDHAIFEGDPGRKELWKRVDEYLSQSFEHELGISLRVAAVGVDSGGHYTQEVYDFCDARKHRNFYALKGHNQPAQPFVSRPTKVGKNKTKLYMVGTDTIKQAIYSRLQNHEPGPGYMHFPMNRDRIDAEYFEQLTAEKSIKTIRQGREIRVWKKTRPRNEALDCKVYSIATLEILNPNWRDLHRQLMEAVKPKVPDEKPESTDYQDLQNKKRPGLKKNAKRTRRKKRGFVNRW